MERMVEENNKIQITMEVTGLEMNKNTLDNEFNNNEIFVGVPIIVNNKLEDDVINFLYSNGLKNSIKIRQGFKLNNKKEYVCKWVE